MNFISKTLLFVDWETFYDTKVYDLKVLDTTGYVRDARFKAHGIAYNAGAGTHWVAGDAVQAWVSSVNWANSVVIAHNAKFDAAVLAWRYGVKPYAWFDTMALAKAVLGEEVSGYSLKSLAEYLGLPAKGEISGNGKLNLTPQELETLGTYCKNDVELCKGIYEKLIPRFPESQFWHVDWTIRAFVEPRLVLDIGALEDGVQAEKARRESVIAGSGVGRETLSSNKRFANYLGSLAVKVPTKISARTGKSIPAFARTDEGFEALRLTLPELHAARLAAKSSLLETRGESLLEIAKTGAFPFDVGFSGAVQTHRYSGGSGAGGNPQNFTRNSFLRASVSAPDGNQLVVGDFAAIELRVLAWLAKEPRLINAIVNGGDIYSEFASKVYGRTITKADKAERQFGKCAILGLGYQMGADRFADTVKQQLKIDLPEKDARATVKLYRDTYFNVPRLWQQAASMIPLIMDGSINCLFFAPFIKVRKNTLVLPSGLEIKYPNLRWIGDECVYDIYKKKYAPEPTKLYGGKLVENICQALAGELLKLAIERAEAAGLPVVGSVHDEALAVHSDGEWAKQTLTRCMEQPPSWWPQIKLVSEVGYGKNWQEAKR